MFSIKKLLPVFAIISLAVVGTVAQQPATPAPSTPDRMMRERSERLGQRGEGTRGRMRHRGGMGRLARELNLTDAQKQQSRDIMRRRLESTKSQREELFSLREKRIAGTFTAEDETRAKALRQEIRSAMEGTREEMAALLTA
ncbi:MAG TPA: Spy/CpxP family protein refolding chaperone, partial [Pyrinomonadaceae bacterium]|nr:Spy/CpxP family protein refolding chaperone [Pyrinomonadaceae bacterium]